MIGWGGYGGGGVRGGLGDHLFPGLHVCDARWQLEHHPESRAEIGEALRARVERLAKGRVLLELGLGGGS